MNDAHAPSVSTPPPPAEAALKSGRPAAPDRAAAPAAEPSPPPAPPLRVQAAEWLGARGVGSRPLAIFALVFASLAALVFLMHHPGVAGVLGVVALAAGELSLVRTAASPSGERRLARSLNPLVDLMIGAGIVAGIASHYPLGMTALALGVLVLLAWLPLLRAHGGSERIRPGAGLWTRADRMAVLLVGVAIGRVGVALLVLVVVLSVDAWLRIERIAQGVTLEPELRSPWVQRVLRPDGSFVPAARWTTLGLTALLLLLLPASPVWRF